MPPPPGGVGLLGEPPSPQAAASATADKSTIDNVTPRFMLGISFPMLCGPLREPSPVRAGEVERWAQRC